MTRNDIAETIFASFLLGLAVLLLLSSGVLAAEPFTSAYTSFDTAKCPHQPGGDEEDYGSWRCPGYRGLPMRLSAGDQRMFVSFGKAGANDIAANETFAAFNSADHGTVEWRLAAGQRQPFATILQWQVMTEADHKAEAKGSSPPPAASWSSPGWARTAPAMSAMSMLVPMATRIGWRARSPTNRPALSAAARTSRSCSEPSLLA